jgi:hypothetical protein
MPPTASQVAGLVAQNIMAIDTKFWMRVATRNDSATSQAGEPAARPRGSSGTQAAARNSGPARC